MVFKLFLIFILAANMSLLEGGYIVFRASWSSTNIRRFNCSGDPDAVGIFSSSSLNDCTQSTLSLCSNGIANSRYLDICKTISRQFDKNDPSIVPPFTGTWNEVRKIDQEPPSCSPSLFTSSTTNIGWFKNGTCTPNYSASELFVHRIYLNRTSSEVRYYCGDHTSIDCERDCSIGHNPPTMNLNSMIACVSTTFRHSNAEYFIVRLVQGYDSIFIANNLSEHWFAIVIGITAGAVTIFCILLCIVEVCIIFCMTFCLTVCGISKNRKKSVTLTVQPFQTTIVAQSMQQLQTQKYPVQCEDKSVQHTVSIINMNEYIKEEVTQETSQTFSFRSQVQRHFADLRELEVYNIMIESIEMFVLKCVQRFVAHQNLHPSTIESLSKSVIQLFENNFIFSMDILKQLSYHELRKLEIPQELILIIQQELQGQQPV